MKPHITFISSACVFVLMSYLILAMNVGEHERVHEQVCLYSQGVPIKEINYFKLSGRTICKNPDDKRKTEKFIVDSYNEIITYNLRSLNYLILLCTIFIMINNYNGNKKRLRFN